MEAPRQRDVDGTDNEALECPKHEPITANTPEDDDVGTSERSAKRSRTSSRERSCSSDTRAFAASTIPESSAAQPLSLSELVTTGHSRVVLNERKLEKRPSATRRSLSRRAKQNCPRRDTTTSLKSQLSQEESIISLDSDSQDFPKDESPPLKVVWFLEIQVMLANEKFLNVFSKRVSKRFIPSKQLYILSFKTFRNSSCN